MSAQSGITDFSHGISAIDSGYVRPVFDAIHLIEEEGRAALVDTGTSHSLPGVLAALHQKGLSIESVDWSSSVTSISTMPGAPGR